MLQRDVDKRARAFGEQLLRVFELSGDFDPATTLALQHGGDGEGTVDVDRLEKPDREPSGDGGEAVPGREEAAGLVERGADESAVDEAGRCLVLRVECEGRGVRRRTFFARDGESDPGRIVAATPAGRIVMWRNSHGAFTEPGPVKRPGAA